MAFVYHFGTRRFLSGIYAEDHPDNLAPVGALFFRHEQPEVDREVLLVVRIYALGVRRPVLEWHFSHCDLPPTDRSNALGIHLPQIFARFAVRDIYSAMLGAHHAAQGNGRLRPLGADD